MEADTKPVLQWCRCGHSPESHKYPESTLYGDCHECPCELYNPPGGLEGVPIHPLFAFTPGEFRMVSCNQCGRFRVLPEGVCERCRWDNDNHGFVENTRPNYCLHSPTREHEIPWITPSLRANACTYCLRTIEQATAKSGEQVEVCREQNRLMNAEKATRISHSAMLEVLSALDGYWDAIETSDLSERSKSIYMWMAENFVRWMRDDFVPGSRKAPYRVKDTKSVTSILDNQKP